MREVRAKVIGKWYLKHALRTSWTVRRRGKAHGAGWRDWVRLGSDDIIRDA